MDTTYLVVNWYTVEDHELAGIISDLLKTAYKKDRDVKSILEQVNKTNYSGRELKRTSEQY
jgi:hypothetical protein